MPDGSPTKKETHMNTAFRAPARNPDPIAGQEAAVSIWAKAEGRHWQIIEFLRQHGSLTHKKTTAGTGIAEISCSPLQRSMQRTGVPGEGGWNPAKACPPDSG